MIKIGYLFLNFFITITLLFCVLSCKHKQKIQKLKDELIITTDLNNEKCKIVIAALIVLPICLDVISTEYLF